MHILWYSIHDYDLIMKFQRVCVCVFYKDKKIMMIKSSNFRIMLEVFSLFTYSAII